MRHIFILNPAAGKTKAALAKATEIEALFQRAPHLGTYEIVYTNAPDHATQIAEEYASTGEAIRLYACGGDGTVSEVLQGMYRYRNAQLAICPCGSANDYVRSFPNHDFTNLEALVTGDVHDVDVINCGKAVSLNIACMGMDADVASKMVKYKHLPLVSGPMAYNLAIADVFFHRIGKNLKITIETTHGKIEREGRYFFALAASGQYYGGGYHGAPMARPDDGILDFVLVTSMSRLKVLSFLPKYKAGNFMDLSCVEHFRGSAMQVHCDEGAVIALDGECYTDTDIQFSLCPHPITFVLPQKATVMQPIFEKPVAKSHGKKLQGACICKENMKTQNSP